MTTIETILARKSVRKFVANKPVSRDDLLALVRAGMAAPSAHNEQPWTFVIVTDRARLDAMGNDLPYAKMLHSAPAAIVVCGDMSKAAEPATSLWVQDCSAATQNILLAAEALGYGAVWTAAYPYDDRMHAVYAALHLPKHLIPLCVIPVGTPDGEPHTKDKWKPENVLWEGWSK